MEKTITTTYNEQEFQAIIIDCFRACLKHTPQHPKQEEQLFINLKQVCELTGYAAPTIYGLIGKNAIPHFKKGQRLFFERAAILAWIKDGKRKTKAEIEASADEQLAGKKKGGKAR